MSSSVWDDPEFRVGGEFVKFDDVGDTVTGVILDIRKNRFDDGKVVPQILLNCDGEERTLTAGQVRLKAELGEQRPEIGDTITVTFTENEKRAGGKTLKHFDVSVVRAGTTPAKAAPQAAPVVPPVATNEAPDLSGLNDAQRAALANLGL